MAQQSYDQSINDSTAWDGDASTGYLPVKGRRIEEYLKDRLQTASNTEIDALFNHYEL